MNVKNNKKIHTRATRISAVFCCVCLMLSLAGCTFGNTPGTPSGSEIPSETVPHTDPAYVHSLLEAATPDGYRNPHEMPVIPDAEWKEPEPLLDFSTGLTQNIHNDEEFNALMNYYLSRRESNISFYACDGFTIDNEILLYRFSLPYVSSSWTESPDNKVYWDIFIRYYPGTYIADAYLSGDTSALDEDELKAYEIAKDFIENTVNKEESFLEKERLIHDYICEKCVYTNPKTGEAVPRHCTAVGVLLDGQANCQGYTDCCNMLGRMAGMDVRSQSGFGDGTPHVWNIIRVGRDWYSLDITYDDTTFEGNGNEYPAYIYFNAGKDILEATHSLRDGSELIPIRDLSDDNYYYYSEEFTDGGLADSDDNAILKTAELMKNHYDTDVPFVSVMAKECYLGSYEIVDPIHNVLVNEGISDHITVSTYHAGDHTFIMCKYS